MIPLIVIILLQALSLMLQPFPALTYVGKLLPAISGIKLIALMEGAYVILREAMFAHLKQAMLPPALPVQDLAGLNLQLALQDIKLQSALVSAIPLIAIILLQALSLMPQLLPVQVLVGKLQAVMPVTLLIALTGDVFAPLVTEQLMEDVLHK